jgi:hypothetical protein
VERETAAPAPALVSVSVSVSVSVLKVLVEIPDLVLPFPLFFERKIQNFWRESKRE